MRGTNASMISCVATARIAMSVVMLLFALGTHAAEKRVIENSQVAKHLTAAQKLSSKKQWDAALAEVDRAQAASGKSAYAEYKIDEFRAYLLTQQRKYAEAAGVFEQLVSSKQATEAARANHLKTAAQLYYQARDYSRSAVLARQALIRQRGEAQMLELLGQAEYLAGNFKAAADALRQLVASAEKAGTKPKESWLQTLLSSYDRLQDRPSANGTWQVLLRHHPKPEYWQAVLRTRTVNQQPPAIELGYRRLMFDLGMLKDPADFEDLAMGAIDAGAPGEAVRALQTGLEQRILTGQDQARFQRMLQYAKQEAAARRGQLDELARNAQRASTGELSMALGRLHLGEGRYDEAAAALQQGLEKGQLGNPEQGRIDLGIALLKDRRAEAARQAFEAVSDRSEWRELAQLWSLRAQG